MACRWAPPATTRSALFSVITDTSGGQFNRYGTYTVPTPRLTKIDVFREPGRARHNRKFSRGECADTRKHDLAAVRVARQDERDVQRSRLVETPWIVREQNDRGFRAANQRGDVARAPRPEPQADEVQMFAANSNRRSCVAQHLIAVRDQGSRHVAVIVVIADDRVHAERRARVQRALPNTARRTNGRPR